MSVMRSLFEVTNHIWALIYGNKCVVGWMLDMQCLLLVNFPPIRQENKWWWWSVSINNCKPPKIWKLFIKAGSLKNRLSKSILMWTELVTKRRRNQPHDTSPYLQDVLFPGLPNSKVSLLSHPKRRNILLPPRLQKRPFGSVAFSRNYVNLTFISYIRTSTIKGQLHWQKIVKIISVKTNIDLFYDYIREKEEDGTIALDYLPKEDMIADDLTKDLTPTCMKVFIKQLRFCCK